MSDSYKIYASKDYVDERALPQDAGEYKQLVTGADGKWVAADRLAWENEPTVLIEQKTYAGTHLDNGSTAYAWPASEPFVLGERYRVFYEGTTYEFQAAEVAGYISLGDLLKDGFLFAYDETENIYMLMDLLNTEERTVGVWRLPEQAAHKISPKYLPEGIGYKELNEVEIFPEESLVFSMQGSICASEKPMSAPVNFVPGTTYKVLFDGTSYTAIAVDYSGLVGIGNMAIMGSVFEESDYPFYIGVQDQTIVVYSDIVESLSHTVGLYEFSETIYPIPPEYITGIELTESDNGKLLGVVEGSIDLVTLTATDVGAEPTITTLDVTKGGTGYNTIADTTYTTARYRASALVNAETDPTVNGVINWQYE